MCTGNTKCDRCPSIFSCWFSMDLKKKVTNLCFNSCHKKTTKTAMFLQSQEKNWSLSRPSMEKIKFKNSSPRGAFNRAAKLQKVDPVAKRSPTTLFSKNHLTKVSRPNKTSMIITLLLSSATARINCYHRLWCSLGALKKNLRKNKEHVERSKSNTEFSVIRNNNNLIQLPWILCWPFLPLDFSQGDRKRMSWPTCLTTIDY